MVAKFIYLLIRNVYTKSFKDNSCAFSLKVCKKGSYDREKYWTKIHFGYQKMQNLMESGEKCLKDHAKKSSTKKVTEKWSILLYNCVQKFSAYNFLV